ncbi:MAG TPA: hypothetical protein VFO93_11565 [Hymenobacter sp.]|uniref:hypothetical protein n=1 Tax=Hymenobacter sp. TaxID=1898978 RepID=UPI002D7F690A|nr:hypothetical protein [Hymenobacter sp.]HET9504171.1 hypothetical protein [Hymenobacter sp.]
MSLLTNDLTRSMQELLASGQRMPAQDLRAFQAKMIAALALLEARARGSQIFYTSGPPAATLGLAGDLAVDRLTGSFYQHTGGAFELLFTAAAPTLPAPAAGGSLPLLSLVRQAAGQVEFLLPAGHATTLGKYRVGLRLREGVLVQLAGRGVKNDARLDAAYKLQGPRTDNGPQLLAVRDELATLPFRQQPKVRLLMPKGGVVAYKNNRWAADLNDLTVDLNGSTLVCDYDGPDNMLGRSIFNGVMLQRNVAGYAGAKEYIAPVLLADAYAGDTELTALEAGAFDDENVWFAGAFVLPWAKETVFRGEPVGARHFEDGSTRILSVDRPNQRLKLSQPLQFDYLRSYPDYTGTRGAPSGVGRVHSLDHPLHRIPARLVFQNGTLVAARSTHEAFAMVAKDLVRLHKVRLIGNLTPTECPGAFEAEDVEIVGEVELDKLVSRHKPLSFIQVHAHGLVSNGGGSGGFSWQGGQSDTSIQVCAPTVDIRGVACHAQAYALYDVSTDTTIEKEADACIQDYSGAQPVEEFRLGGNSFGATNRASAYIDIAAYREYYLSEVDDDGCIVQRWDGSDNQQQFGLWKCAAPGTPLFTVDGAKGGRILETRFTKYGNNAPGGIFRTSYTGPRLAAGETVTWTHIKTVRDDEGHRVLTPGHPATLYSEDALIWKGNQLPATATSRTVTITKRDLLFNEHGAAYFKFRAFPTSVTFRSPAAAAGGKVKVSMLTKNKDSGIDLACFALNSTTPRTCSASASSGGMTGIDAGEPELNQFRPAGFGRFYYYANVYVGNISLAAAPDFSLIFTFDTY